MTPAMASTARVVNLLTTSAGFDAGKVRSIGGGGYRFNTKSKESHDGSAVQ